MKRLSVILLLLLAAVSLSACEPKEKAPIVVSAPTSSLPQSELQSSEAVSSEAVSSAPKEQPKAEPAVVTEYLPFTADFAIDAPAPETEIDAELQQRIESGGIVPLESGACLDLDGDGKGEAIAFELVHPEENPDGALVRLTVGNRRIELESTNPTGELYAARLSASGRLQLLVPEQGPSADPYTTFFEYEKGGLWHIGGVEGSPAGFTRTPNGTFTSSTRAEVLQNWRYPQEYLIADGGVLSATEGQYVPSCVTKVPPAAYPMGTIVRLTARLPLQESPDADSPQSIVLPFNRLAVLSASDNAEWVYVTSAEPSPQGGWLRIKRGSFSTCIIDGEEREATELFGGLNISD